MVRRRGLRGAHYVHHQLSAGYLGIAEQAFAAGVRHRRVRCCRRIIAFVRVNGHITVVGAVTNLSSSSKKGYGQ